MYYYYFFVRRTIEFLGCLMPRDSCFFGGFFGFRSVKLVKDEIVVRRGFVLKCFWEE